MNTDRRSHNRGSCPNKARNTQTDRIRTAEITRWTDHIPNVVRKVSFPSPRPSSPGRGGTDTAVLERADRLSNGRPQRSPSPWGEGRGEGDRGATAHAQLLPVSRQRDFSDHFVVVAEIFRGQVVRLEAARPSQNVSLSSIKWRRGLGRGGAVEPQTRRILSRYFSHSFRARRGIAILSNCTPIVRSALPPLLQASDRKQELFS
jgi:hypothetical protein